MAEKETRTPEQEQKDLTAASDNVLKTFDELAKAGSGDEAKMKAFVKAQADFTNMVRLSIVREGGLPLGEVLDIAKNLETKLGESADNLKAIADKEKTAAIQTSIINDPFSSKIKGVTNLRTLGNTALEAETKVLDIETDLYYTMTLGSDHMAESYKKYNQTPVVPTDFPKGGETRSK